MAEKLKLYNLPQNVEGGMAIDGVTLPGVSKKVTVMFHKLDDMSSDCTIEGTDKVIHLPADTPLIYEDGQYSVDES